MLSTVERPEGDEFSYAAEETDLTNQVRVAVSADDILSVTQEYQQECEETLITDHRAQFGPAQHVERKLSTLLQGAWLPVSHMRLQPLQGTRTHC